MAQPVLLYKLGLGPIRCHCWNKDRTQLAVSPGNKEIHIFTFINGDFNRVHVLDEHDLPITGLDWAPNSNRIVSCSQDKNAFVWTFNGKQWKPELVLIKFSRAATAVKWSPSENKFAVGSGAKMISVCHYEKENDWWLSKQIRKPFRSTVSSFDWHPNNVLLAVGCFDFKTRIMSAYVKDVDGEKPSPTPWGNKCNFGQLITEFSNRGGGWVHAVQFSPSGTRLAWVGHDSSLSVIDATAPNPENDQNTPYQNGNSNGKLVANSQTSSSPSHKAPPRVGSITTLKDWYLPFTTLLWVSEDSLVVAGHDCCPFLFTYNGPNKLEFVSKLDVPSEKKVTTNSAFNKFRTIDDKSTQSVDTKLDSLHQNSITQLYPIAISRNKVSKFSTSAIDGQIGLWDLQRLEQEVSSIKIV